jgi:hypothetical protein
LKDQINVKSLPFLKSMEGARTLLLLLVIYVKVHDNEVGLWFKMGKTYKWGKFLYATLELE